MPVDHDHWRCGHLGADKLCITSLELHPLIAHRNSIASRRRCGVGNAMRVGEADGARVQLYRAHVSTAPERSAHVRNFI